MGLPKIYRDFYDRAVFTFEEVAERYKNNNTAGSIRIMLHNERNKGYLGSVKRGLYYIIPQGFSKDDYVVDKYLVANKLAGSGLLSYHTALELHGVAQSTFNQVYILSDRRIQSFDFQGTTFIGIAGDSSFGVTFITRGGMDIRVADRERTVIDGIDRLKYTGGLEEYLKSIMGFPSVDFEIIERYLKKYNKASLYSKVGFVLSSFGKMWFFPEKVRSRLKSKIGKKTNYLYRTKGGRLNKEWNLILPANFNDYVAGV